MALQLELQLEIFVNVLSGVRGTTITLILNPLDTIKDVKSRIQAETNIEVAKQKLLFDGRPLSEDFVQIIDCDIYDQATIVLVLLTLISIRFVTGETLTIEVNLSTDTSETIKRLIEAKEGIPFDLQQLFFEGQELTNCSSTLSECNVGDDSVLLFLMKQGTYQVNLETFPIYSGSSFIELTVKPTDSISDVKTKVVAKEGIPINKQRFIYNGKQLQDDDTLLKSKVFTNDTIHLLYPLNPGACIFLSGQATSSNIYSCSFKFKIGDHVVLHPALGGIITGKVRWVGSLKVLEYSNNFLSTVGIETDSKVKLDRDFPELYLNVARSCREDIFEVGFFRGRIFLPEQLVVHAHKYKEESEKLQQMTIDAKLFNLSVEEYQAQITLLQQNRSSRLPITTANIVLDKKSTNSSNEFSEDASMPSVSLPECTFNGSPQKDKEMFNGDFPGTNKIMAGLQLNQSLKRDTLSDNSNDFHGPPGKNSIVPMTSMSSENNCLDEEHVSNPLCGMAPTRVESYTAVDAQDLLDKYTGEYGGIQGHSGSSLLDAIIFGLFGLNESLDVFLCEEPSCVADKSIAEKLLKGILNPLRKFGLARFESVMDFKICLASEEQSTTLSIHNILNLLFSKSLGVIPFLSIRGATGKILEEYFIEFEFINETFSAPHNTDSLLLNLFNDQKLILTNIPSTLIILLPQHIGNTKKVIPTIHIDVGPFIEHGPSLSAATNSEMELLSVICFNQANKQHVCYSRSGSTWLFHDSMSTRTQNVYIPKVTDVSQEINGWVYNHEILPTNNAPTHVQCFLEDSQMFVYRTFISKAKFNHANYDVLNKERLQELLKEKTKERPYSLSETIATLQKIQSDNSWLDSSFNHLTQSHLKLLDEVEVQQQEFKQLAITLQSVKDEYAETSQQKDETIQSLKTAYEQKIDELEKLLDNTKTETDEKYSKLQQLYDKLLHDHQLVKAELNLVTVQSHALNSELRDKDNKILLLEQQYKKEKESLVDLQDAHYQLEEKFEEVENALSLKQDEATALKEEMAAINESWKLGFKEVTLTHEILGRGGWGEVITGIFCEQKVAVKKLHDVIVSDVNLELMNREINTMAQLRHPNLLQFIGAIFDHPSGNPMIITEIMDTSLRKAYECKELTPENRQTILSIMRDVAVGLNYLHCLPDPIIHRDVSSANVLLEARKPGKWKTKIADFGSAKIARSAFTKAAGALVYSAPESLQSIIHLRTRRLTPKMDVFSFGVLFCEVINCQFPCSENFTDLVGQVRSSSKPAYELIVRCIMEDPSERPTMKTVIQNIDNFC